jgi:XapX domain-containing protein
VGGPLFEPALQSLAFGGRQVVIASPGNPRVSFNLVDFYHNFSRLLGVDSYGLTTRQIAEITDELRPGFEPGALKPPPIEIVPFERAVDAYSRMASRQTKAKQVLSFDRAAMDNRESPMKISIIAAEGKLEMKGLLISFVVGLIVGVVYGVVRVKSPAPPIVALLGLLEMVLGEQAGGWFLTKKMQVTNAASAHIVGELEHQQQRPNVQSVISAMYRRTCQ